MSGCRFGRLRISIHAPQWGATATPSPSLSSFVISIHAPQWGATVPYGCVFGVVVISIHAPQWGATRAALEPWARVANFNPRTPVGCDVTTLAVDAGPVQFQSTHPSGVRLSILTYCYLTILFQSTHPSGVRLRLQKHFFSCPKYFNPRTPVGCDLTPISPKNSPLYHFNPRTPVGCDSTIRGRLMATWLFQSTHPSGVRQTADAPRGRCRNFNPRTPVGCDRPERASLRRRTDFNPRTPVGCDAQGNTTPVVNT